MKINNTTLLLALLAVVVVVSGIQTIEIYTLSSLIKSGAFVASNPSSGSSLLAGLATQVGGCGG